MKSKLGLLPSRLLLSVGHDMTNGCRVAALEKVTSLSLFSKYRPPPLEKKSYGAKAEASQTF